MTESASRRAIPVTTLFALGIIGILGPFGTDIYLPALPQMAADLGTSESNIRLTLSLYTLGMATGQLVIGALSDRFGRRRLMISGGLVVAIAALSASKAENLSTLLLSCVVLGIGSAAGLVTGRAVIADKTTGSQATKYFSLLQMVVSLGPIIGPVAGAILLGFGDWRTIFAGLSVFAVAGVLGAMMFVPETLSPQARQSAHPFKVIALMSEVLRNRQYLLFAATMWLGFGMLFAYISTSSFIFQSTLGVSSQIYAADFALNGVGLVGASLLTSRLAHRFAPERIILFGLTLQGLSMVSLIFLTSTNTVNLWTVAVCLFLLATSMGFVFGPSTSLAIAPVRYASGTALAMVGSFQFVSAGIASSLTALASPQPLVGFLMVGSIATAGAVATATAGYRFLHSRP
ncbi:multidrug effflux MFS transporter [uncultured Aurantimicrobium sp.]|uniref:multidrug effflux MFS transporter n=1 Tax=uncultured Aurantimicrobium sp. TaxID=1705357 RepID=UPI0026026CF5|nr:multidrug effflux MFS transporter [uncultured Aurantimicrobium sp.]